MGGRLFSAGVGAPFSPAIFLSEYSAGRICFYAVYRGLFNDGESRANICIHASNVAKRENHADGRSELAAAAVAPGVQDTMLNLMKSFIGKYSRFFPPTCAAWCESIWMLPPLPGRVRPLFTLEHILAISRMAGAPGLFPAALERRGEQAKLLLVRANNWHCMGAANAPFPAICIDKRGGWPVPDGGQRGGRRAGTALGLLAFQAPAQA
jgi:hypothetical protein